MDNMQGPYPSVGFKAQMAANVLPPFVDSYSGELTANVMEKPMGAPRLGGSISDIWLSVQESGKDDTSTLSLTADVMINGTSCLTTKPVIAHVSGEASQQKTSKVLGDTGITQAVINTAANTVAPGDVITYNFELTRTASPTTEMKHPVITVEFQP